MKQVATSTRLNISTQSADPLYSNQNGMITVNFALERERIAHDDDASEITHVILLNESSGLYHQDFTYPTDTMRPLRHVIVLSTCAFAICVVLLGVYLKFKPNLFCESYAKIDKVGKEEPLLRARYAALFYCAPPNSSVLKKNTEVVVRYEDNNYSRGKIIKKNIDDNINSESRRIETYHVEFDDGSDDARVEITDLRKMKQIVSSNNSNS